MKKTQEHAGGPKDADQKFPSAQCIHAMRLETPVSGFLILFCQRCSAASGANDDKSKITLYRTPATQVLRLNSGASWFRRNEYWPSASGHRQSIREGASTRRVSFIFTRCCHYASEIPAMCYWWFLSHSPHRHTGARRVCESCRMIMPSLPMISGSAILSCHQRSARASGDEPVTAWARPFLGRLITLSSDKER